MHWARFLDQHSKVAVVGVWEYFNKIPKNT